MKLFKRMGAVRSCASPACELLTNRSCRFLLYMSVVVLLLAGCPNMGDSLNDDDGSEEVEFSGTVIKGPFQAGSLVIVRELQRSTLDLTGVSFTGEVTNDVGGYSASGRMRPGPVEVLTSGQFFNEVSGENTEEPLILTALTENAGRVNVNVITALERNRVRFLVSEEGLSFTEAKDQAVNELFAVFGAVPEVADSTQIELESEDGKILLMVSAIIATDEAGEAKSVGAIESLLSLIRNQFEAGELTANTMLILRAFAERVDHERIQDNLAAYYESIDAGAIDDIEVPSFQPELDSFRGVEAPLTE